MIHTTKNLLASRNAPGPWQRVSGTGLSQREGSFASSCSRQTVTNTLCGHLSRCLPKFFFSTGTPQSGQCLNNPGLARYAAAVEQFLTCVDMSPDTGWWQYSQYQTLHLEKTPALSNPSGRPTLINPPVFPRETEQVLSNVLMVQKNEKFPPIKWKILQI